ncbi:hypothetical protein [Kytococcus sedentarius]|uniref:hypothetical protein n=1 Tax=Kytococcus sedentarius TaxID=1276 RepID=UPI0035BC530B
MGEHMENPPAGEPRGDHQKAVNHGQSTESAADLLALETYAGRSDVAVIVAVENRNGKWRRTLSFTLDAGRKKYRRALANGHRAVLFTAELRVTHHHASTLAAIAALDSEVVER